MAYFRCGGGVPSSVKTLPTYKTASGSVATFETDMTENLISCVCEIVATQSGSGTPSPSNPRPIQTYTSLNLSHSGADTSNPTVYNIPFGQTVANGVLDITTGKLHITHYCYELNENWGWSASGTYSGSMWIRFTAMSPVPTNRVCIMSHFETVQTISQYGAGKCLMDYNSLNCWLSDGATLSDWENYIVTQRTNGTPIQLYAELATPIEIQLDSITLQALLNENNIWCDTGDISAKYILSVGEALRQG